ncbi:hypothetical protein V8C37DRAFT_57759 [Trichoderma ceciliae]
MLWPARPVSRRQRTSGHLSLPSEGRAKKIDVECGLHQEDLRGGVGGSCRPAMVIGSPGHPSSRNNAASSQSLPTHSSPPHDLKTFAWSAGHCFFLLSINETRELNQRMLTGAASFLVFLPNRRLSSRATGHITRTGDFLFILFVPWLLHETVCTCICVPRRRRREGKPTQANETKPKMASPQPKLVVPNNWTRHQGIKTGSSFLIIIIFLFPSFSLSLSPMGLL